MLYSKIHYSCLDFETQKLKPLQTEPHILDQVGRITVFKLHTRK